jgi:lipopolysaccharide heptosyltransferase II
LKGLIVLIGAIGDVVMASAAAQALKNHREADQLDWLVGQWSAPVLENNPNLREKIIVDDRIFYQNRLIPIVKLILDIRIKRYDYVLCFHRSWKMNVFIKMLGAKKTFGFSRDWSGKMLSKAVLYDPKEHKVDQCLKVVGLVDGKSLPGNIKIYLTEDEIEEGRKLLAPVIGRKIVAVSAGGGSNPGMDFPYKRWPTSYFAEVCRRLIERTNAQIVLVGGRDDEEANDKVNRLIGSRALNLTGRTSLRQLAAVLSLVNLLLTNDSGPMHIGVAVGAKVAAIMGPTNPAQTGPYGNSNIVFYKGNECSPCFNDSRKTTKCSKHACMLEIEPEEVFNAIKKCL